MSETREVDAWEGDTFLLRRAWQKRPKGLLLIAQPTDRRRARRPTREHSSFVTRATIAISSELYLRHVTRASPLFVRASGH